MGFHEAGSKNIDSERVLEGQGDAVVENEQTREDIEAASESTVVTQDPFVEPVDMHGLIAAVVAGLAVFFAELVQHLLVLDIVLVLAALLFL